MLREVHAVRGRGMSVEPELEKGIGSGIVEIDPAHDLIHLRGEPARIGNERVHHFQFVDIGLPLLPAAVAVYQRIGKKAKQDQNGKCQGQYSPVLESADSELWAVACNDRAKETIGGDQTQKQQQRTERNTLGHVIQRVMAKFVRKDVLDLFGCERSDGRIPYDNAP